MPSSAADMEKVISTPYLAIVEGQDAQVPCSLENDSSGKDMLSHLCAFAHAGFPAQNASFPSWGTEGPGGLG